MYKPINSKEAVEDAIAQQNSPLFMCNFDGTISRRKPGKDCNQTWYSITREPKESDNAKFIDPKNYPEEWRFVDYLLNLENGELDVDYLYANVTTSDPKVKPIVNIYDTINIKINGKKIETTIGRLLLNKAMLYPIEHHPRFEFLNETCTYKVLQKYWKLAVECQIEGTLPEGAILDMVDSANEFGLRLSTVFNAGLTSDMMVPDEKFRKYRDKVLNTAMDKFKKSGDYQVISDAEKEIINYVKDRYKDDDMMELYVSENKAKLNNDWKNMNIMMGAMPDMAGGNPVIINNSLIDGIDNKFLPLITNVAMIGAMDRGLNTAYAGTIKKDLDNGGQSIYALEGDCGSTITKDLLVKDPIFDILHRYIMENGKPVLITLDNMNKYKGKTVKLRYPLGCKHKDGHYCSHCVGEFLFKSLKTDKVNIGVYVSEIGSNLLNVLMSSTHNLGANIFKIDDWNKYVYPNDVTLFEHRLDPITKTEKVYCLKEIKWILPQSAINPVDNYYEVLAHGSILDSGDSKHSIIFGSDVTTTPSEIIKPKVVEDDEEGEFFDKHVIFVYKPGDVFLYSTASMRSNMTVYRMMKVFLGGNLSNLVPLETHLQTLKNNFNANVELGAADLSLEILASSLARDIKDPSKPVRETGTSEYRFISLYELGVMGGTFNAVFGPNAAKSLMISLSKTEDEQTKTLSPMETALRY